MSDLISRQAAIDAIKEIYEWHDNVTKERIIEHFVRLPSAQPERTEERAETHACDLIDREAAVDAIYHHLPSVSRTRARTMLHEVPSAQPERKKGEWISNDIDPEAWNFCSVCGEQAIDLFDFCPNCGADMRGEQDG